VKYRQHSQYFSASGVLPNCYNNHGIARKVPQSRQKGKMQKERTPRRNKLIVHLKLNMYVFYIIFLLYFFCDHFFKLLKIFLRGIVIELIATREEVAMCEVHDTIWYQKE